MSVYLKVSNSECLTLPEDKFREMVHPTSLQKACSEDNIAAVARLIEDEKYFLEAVESALGTAMSDSPKAFDLLVERAKQLGYILKEKKLEYLLLNASTTGQLGRLLEIGGDNPPKKFSFITDEMNPEVLKYLLDREFYPSFFHLKGAKPGITSVIVDHIKKDPNGRLCKAILERGSGPELKIITDNLDPSELILTEEEVDRLMLYEAPDEFLRALPHAHLDLSKISTYRRSGGDWFCKESRRASETSFGRQINQGIGYLAGFGLALIVIPVSIAAIPLLALLEVIRLPCRFFVRPKRYRKINKSIEEWKRSITEEDWELFSLAFSAEFKVTREQFDSNPAKYIASLGTLSSLFEKHDKKFTVEPLARGFHSWLAFVPSTEVIKAALDECLAALKHAAIQAAPDSP